MGEVSDPSDIDLDVAGAQVKKIIGDSWDVLLVPFGTKVDAICSECGYVIQEALGDYSYKIVAKTKEEAEAMNVKIHPPARWVAEGSDEALLVKAGAVTPQELRDMQRSG